MSVSIGAPVKLTDYRWLNLFNVPYTTPDGRLGQWTFASRKPNPQTGTAPIVPDAVVIVPFHTDESGDRKLVVIKEFRIPLGRYEIGFPAGLFDGSESPEECALRELKEETGFSITQIKEISPPIISSAGLSDESVVMVFCECTGDISYMGNEATEDIEVLLLNQKEISYLLADRSTLISAKTWPILYMYKNIGFS